MCVKKIKGENETPRPFSLRSIRRRKRDRKMGEIDSEEERTKYIAKFGAQLFYLPTPLFNVVADFHADVQKRRRDHGGLGSRSTKKGGDEGNRESGHKKTDLKGTNDKLY